MASDKLLKIPYDKDPVMTRPIDTIFIHCSATRPSWMESHSLESKIDAIRLWHVEDNGWSDIGYHYLIDRSGEVGVGRPVEVQGAHVYGYNETSIGVCLIGGHGSNENDSFKDNYTSFQEKALRKLLIELEDKYNIVRIRGHNEVAAKACPGFQVNEWIKDRYTEDLQEGVSNSPVRSLGIVGIIFSLFRSLFKS